MPKAKDTYKETCVDEKLHKTKMKELFFQAKVLVMPLYEEKDREQRKGVKDQAQEELEEKRSWQSCLLVRQMTPDDHDYTTRGNDGTLDAE
jgi:hypothetical protein